MRRLAIALYLTAPLALLPLAACATLPASPSATADRTVLDEQAAMSVELAYKGMRTALEIATDAGLIRGERAVTVAALDRRAYALVQAVRAAYRAGNAADYVAAALRARAAIDQALAALRGR